MIDGCRCSGRRWSQVDNEHLTVRLALRRIFASGAATTPPYATGSRETAPRLMADAGRNTGRRSIAESPRCELRRPARAVPGHRCRHGLNAELLTPANRFRAPAPARTPLKASGRAVGLRKAVVSVTADATSAPGNNGFALGTRFLARFDLFTGLPWRIHTSWSSAGPLTSAIRPLLVPDRRPW